MGYQLNDSGKLNDVWTTGCDSQRFSQCSRRACVTVVQVTNCKQLKFTGDQPSRKYIKYEICLFAESLLGGPSWGQEVLVSVCNQGVSFLKHVAGNRPYAGIHDRDRCNVHSKIRASQEFHQCTNNRVVRPQVCGDPWLHYCVYNVAVPFVPYSCLKI